MNASVDTRTETMMIPFKVSETQYNLIILLAPRTMERLTKFDPFENSLQNLPPPYRNMSVKRLLIATPTEDDMKQIVSLTGSCKTDYDFVTAVWNIVNKGHNFDQKLGDGQTLYGLSKAKRVNH